MTKFKIFFGMSNKPADHEANEWLIHNPKVKILQMKYQQSRYGEHSICIMYEEE